MIEAIVPLGVDALTIVEEEAAKAYGRAARAPDPQAVCARLGLLPRHPRRPAKDRVQPPTHAGDLRGAPRGRVRLPACPQARARSGNGTFIANAGQPEPLAAPLASHRDDHRVLLDRSAFVRPKTSRTAISEKLSKDLVGDAAALAPAPESARQENSMEKRAGRRRVFGSLGMPWLPLI